MSTNFILTDEQSSNLGDQLSFDFQSVVEKNEKEKNTVKLTIPHSDPQKIKIPYLNTPDNFLKNFTEISTAFESDTVEAARYLLRVMTKPSRDLTLSNMQKAGCSDRESYHRYLMDYLQKDRETSKQLKGVDDKKVTEIVNEFRAGKIDENTAKVRLRTEANYPEWVGADQLLQTKAYLEWQSKLERYNKRKYDFIGTLPEGFRKAREWFVYEKFIFNGESKSISNYINEQMDAGTLVVTGNGVNGYNLGKYGYLFAQYLINSLQIKQDKTNNQINNSELTEDPESEERTPKDYKLHYVDMINGKRVFNSKKYIHVGTEGVTNESVAFIRKDGSVKFYYKNTPEIIKNEIIETAHKIYGQAKTDDDFKTIQFRPFGAWTDFNSRLSLPERERLNNEAVAVLEKAGEGTISDIEKAILRRYSGFGGISASDERGVLYDYYTSPPVAHLVWQLLEKSGQIKAGANILEPSCGTGVFFEYAPKDKALTFAGVELDERTAKVAQHIHNTDNILILNSSYEAFNLSGKAGYYDHVIGNAPFGERGAALSALDMPEEKSLDNYFVSRSIDNLKDNGTMALIVAPGVLENKTNEGFRLSLNKKAQFIGAVKLPNRSFHHTHTQVMPDILLFRKYPQDIQDRLSAIDDATFKETPLYDHDFVSGTYFEQHPEHIAGILSKGTGQWGNDEIKGDITPESLEQILTSFKPANIIPEDIFRQTRDNFELPEISEKNDVMYLSDEELQHIEDKTLTRGAVKISENSVYILSKYNSWNLVSEDAGLAGKLTDIKGISETIHSIQDGMKAEKDSSFIKPLQEQCIRELHKYEEKYGNLPADDPDLKRFTRDNPAVQGIYETFLPITDPLLTQKNVYRKEVEILDGHNTAISALLLLRERMKDTTEETIRASFPDTAETLITEMRKHDDVFITTEGCYQLREEFISGDAWKKIDELKAAADKKNTAWRKEKLLYGAGELEKAVGWTPIEDADFSPRSSWVPQEIVRDWASNKEALGNSQLEKLAKNDEGKWGINVYTEWQEYADPLIYYLNGQKQRSKYYDTEAYNKEHDDLFRSFISNHENYRAQLESEYNRKFKTHIVAPVKTYPVVIAGWKDKSNGGKDIKPHQWQSIHHLYRNQRGISALGTGFGKTVTAIALMSLLRQEDKAHRIFLQVPNNKIKDWIEEIHDVMPSLKIASIDPEESGYSSRDKRYAKYQAMARSDADIILMPESSASEIQLSAENDARITQEISILYKIEKSGSTARQQEMAALKGEYKAASGKTNVTVCFEDFGCDAIFVDEAHRYKNLYIGQKKEKGK